MYMLIWHQPFIYCILCKTHIVSRGIWSRRKMTIGQYQPCSSCNPLYFINMGHFKMWFASSFCQVLPEICIHGILEYLTCMTFHNGRPSNLLIDWLVLGSKPTAFAISSLEFFTQTIMGYILELLYGLMRSAHTQSQSTLAPVVWWHKKVDWLTHT